LYGAFVATEPIKRVVQEPLRLMEEPFRYLIPHANLGATFGTDWFGRYAERMARTFGTPQYIFTQTVVVIAWITFNGYSIFVHFDPYPFILLNLAFSTQAAYAAPLILLAQTRQAERDQVLAAADAQHRESLAKMQIEKQEAVERDAEQLRKLLEQNTELTQQTRALAERIGSLTRELHEQVCRPPG
jgi:uncharacterized membrane protein